MIYCDQCSFLLNDEFPEVVDFSRCPQCYQRFLDPNQGKNYLWDIDAEEWEGIWDGQWDVKEDVEDNV